MKRLLTRLLFHRHTWQPLRVIYRYKEYRTGRLITVKRCQCRVCGKLTFYHFDGKNIVY